MESDRRAVILLVEDNLDEEALILRALKRSASNCDIVVTHSTEEALDYLLQRGDYAGKGLKLPSVVLTDYRIPPEGGSALVSEMRANPQTALIPIVVFSGSASASEIHDLYFRGANSFLEKPLDFDDFCQTIDRLATYWGGLNLTPKSWQKVSYTTVL